MEAANQMTRKLVVVSPHDSLAKAKALMDSRNFRHVPVVEDGKLVGILPTTIFGGTLISPPRWPKR